MTGFSTGFTCMHAMPTGECGERARYRVWGHASEAGEKGGARDVCEEHLEPAIKALHRDYGYVTTHDLDVAGPYG